MDILVSPFTVVLFNFDSCEVSASIWGKPISGDHSFSLFLRIYCFSKLPEVLSLFLKNCVGDTPVFTLKALANECELVKPPFFVCSCVMLPLWTSSFEML